MHSSLLRIFHFFSKIIKLLVCGAQGLTDEGGSLIFAVLFKSTSRSSREGRPDWAIEFPFCREGLGGLVRHGSFKMLLNCSYWSQDTFREQFKVSHAMVIVKLEPPGRGHWPMVEHLATETTDYVNLSIVLRFEKTKRQNVSNSFRNHHHDNYPDRGHV